MTTGLLDGGPQEAAAWSASHVAEERVIERRGRAVDRSYGLEDVEVAQTLEHLELKALCRHRLPSLHLLGRLALGTFVGGGDAEDGNAERDERHGREHWAAVLTPYARDGFGNCARPLCSRRVEPPRQHLVLPAA